MDWNAAARYRNRMTRFASWLIVVLGFGLFLGASVYALRQRMDAGKGLPPYSVYGRDRDGLGDAADFVRRLGREPIAVTRPLTFLPSSTSGPRLLVVVEPHGANEEADVTESDVRGLLRWVEAGNTLLLCGRNATALHRELEVSLRGDGVPKTDDPPRDAVPAEGGSYTDEVDVVSVEGSDTMTAPRGLPLWTLDDRPGAVLLRHGKGRVIVVADPSLLTRRGLRGRDNAIFLRNVVLRHARDGRVYFDEYHHGIRAGSGFWPYLRYHGQQALLLPLLLAAAVAFWAVAVRLGPGVTRPDAVHADAVDFASALSRIYRRTGSRQLLARGLARDFLAALTKSQHLRKNALPAEILAAWRERSPGTSSDELQSLLRGVAELRRGDLTDRRLLALTRGFDRFLQHGSGVSRRPDRGARGMIR